MHSCFWSQWDFCRTSPSWNSHCVEIILYHLLVVVFVSKRKWYVHVKKIYSSLMLFVLLYNMLLLFIMFCILRTEVSCWHIWTGSLWTGFQHCLLQNIDKILILPGVPSMFDSLCPQLIAFKYSVLWAWHVVLNWCLWTWSIQILLSEQMYYKWQVVYKYICCSFKICLGRVLCKAAVIGMSTSIKLN